MAAQQLKLSTSIQSSFGKPDDPDYVFDIVTNADQSVMAVSLSTNAIKLYDPGTGSFLSDLLGHTGTISGLTSPEVSCPLPLYSSSADGTIRGWDLRQSKHMTVLRAPTTSDEIWCLSVGGGTTSNLVAGGTDTKVLLWDLRSSKLLAQWEDWHNEPVTQTLFHPKKRAQLVTGSVDGIINVIDTSGSLDSEEIVENTLSPGVSIAKIGIFGKGFDKIWILTHIETLSIWNLEEALEEATFGDTRATASQKWSLPAVNYLINCYSSPGTDSLWLAAGTSSGSVGYFPVEYSKPMSDGSMPGTGIMSDVAAVLAGGHSDVVRTIWLNENHGSQLPGTFCWSGGEDGKLCCWSQNEIPERIAERMSERLVLVDCKNKPLAIGSLFQRLIDFYFSDKSLDHPMTTASNAEFSRKDGYVMKHGKIKFCLDLRSYELENCLRKTFSRPSY